MRDFTRFEGADNFIAEVHFDIAAEDGLADDLYEAMFKYYNKRNSETPFEYFDMFARREASLADDMNEMLQNYTDENPEENHAWEHIVQAAPYENIENTIFEMVEIFNNAKKISGDSFEEDFEEEFSKIVDGKNPANDGWNLFGDARDWEGLKNCLTRTIENLKRKN